VRFHQAFSFLSTAESLQLATASEELGFHGLYGSDHIFNAKDLHSRYTYSTEPDGSPFWPKDTEWPDLMCLFSAMAARTERLTFTTGVYIAPARDLATVAKSVGTADVISGGRLRLGVGVGWCKEEFDVTGQEFHNDVPLCQMEPSPRRSIQIYGGGHSAPALRRSAELCDGWLAAGAYQEDEAWRRLGELEDARRRAGRQDEPFDIFMALGTLPDVDTYKRFEDAGVTDMVCAPWMFAPVSADTPPEELHAARVAAMEQFATDIFARCA
jgi:alkanesulfonate monooxygenase SsuD/methylene tetrahydromethanopterin reductase-like flavin-dependent oxidoreductase (luciferase family)